MSNKSSYALKASYKKILLIHVHVLLKVADPTIHMFFSFTDCYCMDQKHKQMYM